MEDLFHSFLLVFYCQLLVLQPVIPQRYDTPCILYLNGNITVVSPCTRALQVEQQETSFPSWSPEILCLLLKSHPSGPTLRQGNPHNILTLYSCRFLVYSKVICIHMYKCVTDDVSSYLTSLTNSLCNFSNRKRFTWQPF